MTRIPLSSTPLMADHRLRHAETIRAVLRTGRRQHGGVVVVHARRRGDGRPARWTVVAGRKVGNAVHRNRAKRRLRAALRSLALPSGTDFVVVARPHAVHVPWELLTGEVERLVRTVTAPQDEVCA